MPEAMIRLSSGEILARFANYLAQPQASGSGIVLWLRKRVISLRNDHMEIAATAPVC